VPFVAAPKTPPVLAAAPLLLEPPKLNPFVVAAWLVVPNAPNALFAAVLPVGVEDPNGEFVVLAADPKGEFVAAFPADAKGELVLPPADAKGELALFAWNPPAVLSVLNNEPTPLVPFCAREPPKLKPEVDDVFAVVAVLPNALFVELVVVAAKGFGVELAVVAPKALVVDAELPKGLLLELPKGLAVAVLFAENENADDVVWDPNIVAGVEGLFFTAGIGGPSEPGVRDYAAKMPKSHLGNFPASAL